MVAELETQRNGKTTLHSPAAEPCGSHERATRAFPPTSIISRRLDPLWAPPQPKHIHFPTAPTHAQLPFQTTRLSTALRVFPHKVIQVESQGRLYLSKLDVITPGRLARYVRTRFADSSGHCCTAAT